TGDVRARCGTLAAPRPDRAGTLALDGRRAPRARRAAAAAPLGLLRPPRDRCRMGDRGGSRPLARAVPARPPDARRDRADDARWLLAGRGRDDARGAPRHGRFVDLQGPRPTAAG